MTLLEMLNYIQKTVLLGLNLYLLYLKMSDQNKFNFSAKKFTSPCLVARQGRRKAAAKLNGRRALSVLVDWLWIRSADRHGLSFRCDPAGQGPVSPVPARLVRICVSPECIAMYLGTICTVENGYFIAHYSVVYHKSFRKYT